MKKKIQQLSKHILTYVFLGLVIAMGIFIITEKTDLNLSSQYNQIARRLNILTKKITRPDYVRGIYLTAYSANQESYRQRLIESAKDSQINTVIIDIKNSYGRILYDSQLKSLEELNAVLPQMTDVKKVLDDFHEAGFYVIARQVVFQDPLLARARPELALKTFNGNTWYNYSGLAWLDPGQEEVWQYNLEIANEAVDLGFDEINFDYIRYPSDGNLKNLNYNLPAGQTKAQVMKSFFAFLSEQLSNKTAISIDMFGLVLDHTDDDYDLGIGQRLVDAVDYFDYVCPMVYPSHYYAGYLGFENPALYPGEVVAYTLKISSLAMANKRAKLRPWLQAFNIGATYDQTKIDAQIMSTEQATSTAGWILWNARNYYPDHIFRGR